MVCLYSPVASNPKRINCLENKLCTCSITAMNDIISTICIPHMLGS